MKTRRELAEEMATERYEGNSHYAASFKLSFVEGWEAADANPAWENDDDPLHHQVIRLQYELAAAEAREHKLVEALGKYMLAFKTVEAQLTLNPGMLGVWRRQFETILGDAPNALAEHRKALELK